MSEKFREKCLMYKLFIQHSSIRSGSLIIEVRLAVSAMMQSKLLSALFIVFAVILVLGAIQSSALAYPQQKQGYSPHNKMMMQPGLYAFGTIAS
jgi:hypothetical protein